MNNPLSLYRSILRAHRSLPSEFRAIGDSYVKQEFQAHANITDKSQLHKFFTEWTKYAQTLSQQQNFMNSNKTTSEAKAEKAAKTAALQFGKDLDAEYLNALPDDKAEQILYLRESIESIYNPANATPVDASASTSSTAAATTTNSSDSKPSPSPSPSPSSL